MTVIMNGGERETYNDSYAARLIEQGKAVPAPKEHARNRKKTEAVTADESEDQDRS